MRLPVPNHLQSESSVQSGESLRLFFRFLHRLKQERDHSHEKPPAVVAYSNSENSDSVPLFLTQWSFLLP